jgi:NitT/TauT family transport system permease protein
MRDRGLKLSAWAAALVTVVVVLAIWQAFGSSLIDSISEPSAIARAIGNWFSQSDLRSAIFSTLLTAAVGFLLTIVIGIVLAGLLASSRLASKVLEPYLSAVNAIPKVALAPLFILVFGISGTGNVYFIALSVFFIPFFTLYQAIRSVDVTTVNHARVLGATAPELVRDVYLPAMVGSLVATLRVTASFCLISAIIFELVASQGGIGYELSLAQQTVEPAVIVSGVVIVAAIAFIVDRLFAALERHFASWRLG